MSPHVALLRGVNVGGGNKVPMAELRALAEGFGWTGVQSYIASGNLVFRATGAPGDLARTLRAGMAERMGVDVPVLVLTAEDFRARLATCPWPASEGKAVHGLLTLGAHRVQRDLVDSLIAPSETLLEAEGVIWMHAPEGFGRSKLAAKLDRVVTGDGITARNLNTLHKLSEMLDAA